MRSRCRRHRLCPRLRASALCAALACCLPAAAPSDSLPGAGVVDVDNQKLPQGERLAVLLVGLFKPKVTDLVALPSIRRHVIDAVGERQVDFYVNSEPGQGATVEQARDAFRVWIPSVSLQALVVSPPGVAPPQLLHDSADDAQWVDTTVLCRKWTQPRGIFVSQYQRLRDLYGLLLGYEIKLGERYGHVVRLRTDTVFVRDWPKQGLEKTVPPASMGGPRFNQNGILLDHFFISSRQVSYTAFYEAPVLFQRGWERDVIFAGTGCNNVHDWEHASIDCHKAVYGINSAWPEAILTMFFRRNLGNHLVDTCNFTGEFVVNSRNSPTLRPCEGVATSESENEDIAEVEKYFEFEMWMPD